MTGKSIHPFTLAARSTATTNKSTGRMSHKRFMFFIAACFLINISIPGAHLAG